MQEEQLTIPTEDLQVLDRYGAHYWMTEDAPAIYRSPRGDTYNYTAFVGRHTIDVAEGDSVWWLEIDEDLSGPASGYAHVDVGPIRVTSSKIAVVIRGYTPERQMVAFGNRATNLPYVNGCSSRQIIPPSRPGDPTLQHLRIPAFSAEQAHHIHSTVRVVYVLRGKGVSVVGMEGKIAKVDLVPGMVCLLDPMCPHHFETPYADSVEVIPLHVFSAVPTETSHPMRNGTYMVAGQP